MVWTVNLVNTQLNSQVTSAIADGSFSYSEVLSLLNTVATGGITASELADLKTVYTNSGSLFASDYVKSITYNVVYGNPANAYWWGGTTNAANKVALGNMSDATTETNANRLIGKWFLGTDLPMPVAGGDTATGKASTGTYSYSIANGSLYVNGVAANDVNQGAAGDCYYVASLGAIANVSQSLITNDIIDNGNGTYGVRFYLNGNPAYTTVNLSLPVYSWGQEAFAGNSTKSLSGELWVSLMEKAYAQLNQQADVDNKYTYWKGENSYQAVEGGWAQPIKQLTNLNYKYYSSYYNVSGSDQYASGAYFSADAQTYKQTIVTALNSGSVGWLGSFGTTYGSNGLKNLVSGHAFMLLGYNSATDKFILRNPWGDAASSQANPQFEASITDFWNSTVKGVVALSDAATTTPVYSYNISSNASSSGSAVVEGGAITFTITRSATGTASNVYVSTTPGTAGASDYQSLDKSYTSVSFSAYETSKTVTVQTYTDSLTEGTENFSLNVYKVQTDTTATASATAFIADAAAQTYNYTLASNAGSSAAAVAEGGKITFTVTRSGSGSTSSVYLTTVDGTATTNDYQHLSSGVLTFAANETSKTVTLDAYTDSATEGTESFSLNLYGSQAATVASATAQGYIKDQYAPNYDYTITSNAGSISTAAGEGGKVIFTITRSGSGTASTVYVSTLAGTAGSSDYVGFSAKAITFAANEKIATVEVPVNEDWWLESTEYFYLNLYKSLSDLSASSSSAAFIQDKPVSAYNYSVTSNAPSASPVTEGGVVTFTVTRDGSGTASTVYVSTQDGTATSSDYQGVSKVAVNFAANETAKTVSVNTYTDSFTEGSEYFWLNVYRNYADTGYAAYGTAYLKDPVQTTDYSYTIATDSGISTPVIEGGTVTFTVTRSSSGTASTVYLSTVDGTTSSTDHQGLDKYALNFAAYETSKTVTLGTYGDSLTEGTEYFWLELFKTYSDATNYNYATYSTAYVKDPAATANYSYSVTSDASYSAPVAEGGVVTFTITRSGSGSISTVYVSTTSGSAVDSDYQGVNKQAVTFGANETSKTVTVTTNSDALVEGNEYFWLDLYKTYNDAVSYNYAAYGTAYIKDPVSASSYNYTITTDAGASTPVTEGGMVTFTVTRSSSGTASTVYLSTVDGTTSSTDHQGLDKYALNFAAYETTKTITLGTYGDSLVEGTEYFWLELFKTYSDASSYNYSTYSTAYVKDAAVATDYSYTVASNASSSSPVTEGGAVTFTITRSGSGSISTVYVSTTDSTTSSADFAHLDKYAVTFGVNETSKTVTVNTYTDTLVEGSENFWLDLYKTYSDAVSYNYAAYGTAYINDASTGVDYSYLVTSDASSSSPVTEGGLVTFTITRSGSGAVSTVYVSNSDGSTSAADYAHLDKYAVTFAANETTKTVTVNTYTDTLTEGNEYFWLDLYKSYNDAANYNYATYGIAYVKDPAGGQDYSYTVASSAGYNSPVTEGGVVTFTVTRSSSGSTSTIYLSTYDGTTSSTDYAHLDKYAVTFGANETSKTVTLNTYTDSLTEGSEYFWLELFKTYNDATNYNYAAYSTGYINDATATTDYTYSVTSNAGNSNPVTEGGIVTFTITRGGSGTVSTVYVSNTDGSTSANDYAHLDKYAVTFAANETSKTVTVATYTDSLTEGSEYFWLDLYKSYNDALNYNWATYGTAYINDSGSTADYNYVVTSNADYGSPVTEGGVVTFTITRSGSGTASTVYVNTTDATTSSTDFAHLDKYAITFGASETTKTVTVNTYTDSLTEGTEHFYLDLFKSYTDAVNYNYASYGNAYIKDATSGVYTYSVVNNTSTATPISEGGAITFTVTRSSSGTASTIYASTYEGSTTTADHQVVDKVALNFAANETTKTVVVNTYSDGLSEGKEYFWLELFNTYTDATNYNWMGYSTAYITDPAVATTTAVELTGVHMDIAPPFVG